MDNNIVQTVHDLLETRTKEISKDVAALDKLNAEIKSNRYSAQTMQNEIFPQQAALRQKVRDGGNAAISEASALIAQYRADAAELDNLDPSDITDDIKLLQSGITLLPRDIQAILKRNAGNRTMLQLALRYAKEHNIDTGGTYYIGGEREKQTADNLDVILTYYKKWITQKDALEMLERFFNA